MEVIELSVLDVLVVVSANSLSTLVPSIDCLFVVLFRYAQYSCLQVNYIQDYMSLFLSPIYYVDCWPFWFCSEGLGRPRLLFSLSGYFCLYAYIRLLVCFLERFSFCLLYNDLTRLRCEVFNFYFQVSIIVNMTSLVFCYSNYDD